MWLYNLTLKGKAMLVKSVFEMQDLDKPRILLQIRSKSKNNLSKLLWMPPFWIFNEALWRHKAFNKYTKSK